MSLFAEAAAALRAEFAGALYIVGDQANVDAFEAARLAAPLPAARGNS
ncbi:MAG: hypothetical protein WAT39_12210 [Planctomycetota bacterium]